MISRTQISLVILLEDASGTLDFVTYELTFYTFVIESRNPNMKKF